MGSRLKKAGAVFVGVVVVFFAAAQLVRPARTNPPIDPARTLQAHPGVPGELISVMDRSCGDCHSNTTQWSRYTNVAPLSWLVVYTVNSGRKVMNMSEWASYSSDDQRELLFQSCKAATEGKMPGGIYTRIRPEAALTLQDVNTICAASRAEDASASKRASTKP